MTKAATKRLNLDHLNARISNLRTAEARKAARLIPCFEKLVLGEAPNVVENFDWNTVSDHFTPPLCEQARFMDLKPPKKR